jgi:hypothetical protein
MAREDGKFIANPAGLSSMLFHHATVLIHGNTQFSTSQGLFSK